LKQFGKEEFSAERVEEHKKAIKDRDTVVEKNKKAKTSKKPEEFVPVVDPLEEEKTVNANGEPIVNYYLVKNPQFRHVNLCLNDLDETFKEPLSQLMKRTPDEFGVTMSGNRNFDSSHVEEIKKDIL